MLQSLALHCMHCQSIATSCLGRFTSDIMRGTAQVFLWGCRCLYIPATDRSEWSGLTRQTIQVLREILQQSPGNDKVH